LPELLNEFNVKQIKLMIFKLKTKILY